MLVTLFVAALSAWVAPALTRQWDDRKSARDLQAATSELIATASADALAELVAAAENPGSTAAIERARKQWLRSQYRISARLNAYFSNDVWNQWIGHYELIGAMFGIVRVAEHPETFHDWCGPGRKQDPCARKEAIGRFSRAQAEVERDAGFEDARPELYAVVYSADGMRDFVLNWAPVSTELSLDYLNEDLLDDHPRGFSMTRNDFFRDLLP